LPGYLYVLAVLARINATNIIPLTILYKLPAIFSDIGTGYLIYLIVDKLKTRKWALISASLYVFNPAIFANSALWGQVDSFTAFFSILSLWALDVNIFLSAAALAIGTLIKPQMAVISLIILFMMLQRKYNAKKIITYMVTSAIIFVAGFLPFSGGTNLLTFIVTRMNVSLNQYPYTSVNAFNFWGIFGGWKPDTGLNIAGGIFIAILFFTFGLKFLKQKGGEYILLAFTYSLLFLFMTRMHERHLLPVFAPLTIAVALNPVFIFALVGFSFIYLANLYWAWVWVTNSFQQAFSDSIVKILSIIDVLLIFVFLIPKKFDGYATNFKNSFLRSRQTSWPVTSFFGNSSSFLGKNNKPENATALSESKISSQKIKIMFVGVIVFASVARLFSLGSPPNNYFDEVYHAFTAQSMLHGVTKAWEWWNPNPTGFAYEWTHPPLAKEGMVLGMSLLGENSFGWRFPGAMLGIGSVILIFFIAKEIFDDDLLALIASAVLSLDGLALVLSRIGMNDSYMLFFALASVYSYLKKRNFWAAIFFGLSVASKWSGLWVAPIILVGHFVFKRKFNWSYLFLFILPPIIYISSYFPIFTSKQIQTEYIQNTGYEQRTDKVGIVPLDMFIDVQKQMWWYHTRLKATHPYSSMWYTWPFLVRPIYLYTSNEIDNSVSRIYAMGNPIIFWGGTAAIVGTAYIAFRERNKKLGFVVFSYLVFFTPWAISPRIMFLYHYLPSIPFMAIAIAYILRRFKEFRIPFLVIALIAFLYFYPHYAGLTIPLQLDSSYYWFTSWR
jgi:dolichyl-phosphate-mannose-protein mannosyltransferase